VGRWEEGEEGGEEEGSEGEEEQEAGARPVVVDPLFLSSLAPLCEQGVLGQILKSMAPPHPGQGFPTQGVTVLDLGLLYSLTLTLLLAVRPSKDGASYARPRPVACGPPQRAGLHQRRFARALALA